MPHRDNNGQIRLTPDEKQELEAMGPDLMNLEIEIKRARRAGLDMEELEVEFRKMKNMRDGMIREYG